MKNSIKISTLLFLLSGLSLGAKAQTTTTSSTSTGTILSVGADGGYSLGSFKHDNKWNFGGSLQADIPVANQLYFTINAAYLNFYGRDNVDGSGLNAPDIHLLPVKAGLKYFPVNYFYLQADAGAAFDLNKSTIGYDRTAAFIYSPQIGVQVPLGGRSYIDAGIEYEASTKFTSGVDNSKVNFLGLRIAYGFGIK
jgi:hypothetical protein